MDGIRNKSIYVTYFNLGNTAYREKVQFVEQNADFFQWLSFEEQVEIEVDYILCLFELGRYDRYLLKVDAAIETVIKENIYTLQGLNIFEELLFKKAACLYQVRRSEESRCILLQLLRMSPKRKELMALYSLCIRDDSSDIAQAIRAAVISTFLLVMAITLVNILLMGSYFEPYMTLFVQVRNGLLGAGLCTMLALELAIHRRIYKETGLFMSAFLNKALKRQV